MVANITSGTKVIKTTASQPYPKYPGLQKTKTKNPHNNQPKQLTACGSAPFQGGAARGPSLPPGHQRMCRWQDPHLQFLKRELSEGDESQRQR